MNSKQTVTGLVGILIGFILGFFVSQWVQGPQVPGTPPASSAGALPENHPTPEMIEKLQHLQEHAEKEPENLDARIQLGNAYYDMGRFDAAIRWYEEALRIDPENVNVNTDLATAYLYTGNPGKGIELYKKSLALDPKHPQTLLNLGVAYFAVGSFAEAIQYWQTLVDAHPDYPNIDEVRKQIEVAKSQMKKGQS